MRLINITTDKSKAHFLSFISDNERVSSGVRFTDKKGGKPFMHVREKDGKVKIKCEMVGRPTKDNGFLMGTVFYGRIKELPEKTTLKGVILTSPIYHIIMLVLSLVMIVQSIITSSLNAIPMLIFVVAFEFLFFSDEFKKQGYISRYLYRAVRRMDERT